MTATVVGLSVLGQNGSGQNMVRTKWYGQNGIRTKRHWTKWYGQIVYGQNGIGQNGMNKMVRTEW